MRVNENEMSMKWNNQAWLLLESGLWRYQSWDSSWCSYVKLDLKIRGIPAASTIRPTRVLYEVCFTHHCDNFQSKRVTKPGPAWHFCISGQPVPELWTRDSRLDSSRDSIHVLVPGDTTRVSTPVWLGLDSGLGRYDSRLDSRLDANDSSSLYYIEVYCST